MKLLASLLLAAFLLMSGTVQAQDHDAQRIAAAQAAATAWLALADAGNYPATWTSGASAFQAAISQENWLQALQQVRTPLGAVKTRTLKSAQFTRRLPNAPEGEYVVIQYDTTFANQPNVVETVTPLRDKDGSWKVSGYFVR